jgi:hypothetical protein
MEIHYLIGTHLAKLTYGETVSSLLKEQQANGQHYVIIANQRYYDLFSDKINHAFGSHQLFNWYICRNDSHCNTISELEGIYTFLAEFDKKQAITFIGLGNEGALQLTTFLRATTIYSANSWLVPTSIQSLSQALLPAAFIEWQNNQVMSVANEPEQIIYDFTLANQKGDGRLVDFMVFIRCGLVCSHDFLQALYHNYPSKKRLQQTSFNGILDQLLTYYKHAGLQIDRFGRPFEVAFLKTENGHLLSGPMKCLLGLLLQLLWCQETAGFDFQFKNFLVWLTRLGFPVVFPKEILIGDYAEKVLQEIQSNDHLVFLKQVGEPATAPNVAPQQILAIIEKYQTIVNEI